MIQPEAVLQDIWGFSEFRGTQKRIVASVIRGTDTLAILPTGGGKSMCYQLPGIATSKQTIVVSPLVALMADQVSGLQRKGIDAAAIVGSQSIQEMKGRLSLFQQGVCRILYVSPERLVSPVFLNKMQECQIGILAIDEAHCISQWGNAFRPSYRRISQFRERVCPHATLIAVTATATKRVARDIVSSLEMRQPAIFTSSVDRPNIGWTVLKSHNKRKALTQAIINSDGSKIVYCNTRRSVERLHFWLEHAGLIGQRYHGGMSMADRNVSLAQWMETHDGLMVATNAFGMGIDKADVRLVCHMALPRNIENFYQEAGRGGRDGASAQSILLYTDADIVRLRKLIDYSSFSSKQVRLFTRSLQKQFGQFNTIGWHKISDLQIAETCKMTVRDVNNLMSLVVRKGIIDGSHDNDQWTTRLVDSTRLRGLSGDLRAHRRRSIRQCNSMISYLDVSICRRRYLLNYFGETAAPYCGRCSVCLETERSDRLQQSRYSAL